jgi:hypothetical protein
MKGFIKVFVLYVLPVIAIVGLIGYVVVRPPSVDKLGESLKSTPDPVVDEIKLERATRDLVLGCTTDMATTFHIHPYLTIFVDDVRLTIPSELGIDAGKCMHPVHTHDATGKIHVESPEPADFALGDFFLVWDKKFNELGTLDAMTVNGADSTEGENLILKDEDKIVLRYKTAGV